MSETASRSDPFGAFNFLVEIDQIIIGGFSEVTGLTIETEVETIKEGGVNDLVYQLPKGTKYSDITLKRGLTDYYFLTDWYKDVIDGKIERKNLGIYLLDGPGKKAKRVRSWDVYEAYPKKWTGPSLNAGSSSFATESLVLAHKYIKVG